MSQMLFNVEHRRGLEADGQLSALPWPGNVMCLFSSFDQVHPTALLLKAILGTYPKAW